MVWFGVWPRVSGLGYDARFGRVGYRRRAGIGVTSEGRDDRQGRDGRGWGSGVAIWECGRLTISV